jgi:anti-sigma B factor antagonist
MAELDSGAPAPLVVESRAEGTDGPVVTVAGDLDISSVEQLRSVVGSLIAERPATLTFDLSKLRFMDSAGIAVLLGAVSKVGTVRVRRPTHAVRRVLELTGLTDILRIEP